MEHALGKGHMILFDYGVILLFHEREEGGQKPIAHPVTKNAMLCFLFQCVFYFVAN